jgi:3-hydroxy-9,10-secoandrosta-1,3,5(10)-triene-9,17-dione monooxygenase
MCATGSEDVVIRDVVVPNYRSLDSAAILAGRTPGAALHESALYRVPLITAHCLVGACTALGAAMSALRHYEDVLRRQDWDYPGGEIDAVPPRMRLARNLIQLDTAWLLHRHALQAAELAGNDLNRDLAHRARARMAATHVVAESRTIVRDILDACGAGAHLLGSAIQRTARDIGVLSGHVLFNMDSTAELYGCVATGRDPKVPLL